MCKLGFLNFAPKIPQDRRRAAVQALAKNSWDMGNKDGIGYVTWDVGGEPIVQRSLKLEELPIVETMGAYALVHARTATSGKGIENCHPFESDGAWLVHNGIVHLDAKVEEAVKKVCKTTCDSEYILGGYVLANRSLKAALAKITGMANVMVYDHKKKVLTMFADNCDFQIWRQFGVTAIIQSDAQNRDIMHSGMGNPYETARIERGLVWEIPLTDDLMRWGEVLQEARKSAASMSVPSYHYESDYESYRPTEGRYPYGRYAGGPTNAASPPNGNERDSAVPNSEPAVPNIRAEVHLSRKQRKKLARLREQILNSDMEALAREVERLDGKGGQLTDAQLRASVGGLTDAELQVLRQVTHRYPRGENQQDYIW